MHLRSACAAAVTTLSPENQSSERQEEGKGSERSSDFLKVTQQAAVPGLEGGPAGKGHAGGVCRVLGGQQSRVEIEDWAWAGSSVLGRL